MTDTPLGQQQEVNMQTQTIKPRNPIAWSFSAGINRPQVVPNKKRDRRVKHRNRWREDNSWQVDGV